MAIRSGVRGITGRPVVVTWLRESKRLSEAFYSGAGRSEVLQQVLPSLAGVNVKTGEEILVAGIPHNIVAVKKDGTPIVALSNVDTIERTENGISYQVRFNPDSRTLYLSVRTPDYFGLLQDVISAARESELEIDEVSARHQRIGGDSQIELICPFLENHDKIQIVFYRFKLIFNERLNIHRTRSGEGEKLLFTYKGLVSAMGRFLNSFPQGKVNAELVEKVFVENPGLSQMFIKYLRIKFDKIFSQYYGLSRNDLGSVTRQIESEIDKMTDPEAKTAAKLMFVFLTAVQNTNVFDKNRNPEVAVFKLSDIPVQELTKQFKISYPTDITYVYAVRTGSFAIGARFGGEVSKGGDRYNKTDDPVSYEKYSRKALEEALRLSATQEIKNLLWGCYINGLKTVLVAAPPVEEGASLEDVVVAIFRYRSLRSYALARDAVLELTGKDLNKTFSEVTANGDKKRADEFLARIIQLENLVNLSYGEDYLRNLGDKRPGPDMNMSAYHMNFLTIVAKHLGVKFWPAIYTGKSADFGGFPHKELKITGIGVFANMLIAMEKLNIDPQTKEVSATIQGFGDVGSAMADLILTKMPNLKLTAISDHTGMLVCASGIGNDARVREEVQRLIREERTLDQFSSAILTDLKGKVELMGKDKIDEIVTMPSTLFIPAAIGNVIHEGNVDKVLANHQLVVEAANIPFTVPAAEKFDAGGGIRIPDAFANGGGVLTSTNEILTIQALGQEEFRENYDQLAKDNESMVRKTAEENSTYVWSEYNRLATLGNPVPFPTLVSTIGRNMTVVKSIIKVTAQIYEGQKVYEILFDSLFPTVLEKVDRDEIIERLGPSIVRELIAAQLARKVVFSHEYDWFDNIDSDKRDKVVLKEVLGILC